MLYVNALWFLSLFFSLSCALFATLVEQWARLYSLAIQRRPAVHKRARIRSYLYEGLLTYRMSMVVKGIPSVLHISLFLFVAGLVIFLFSVNTTIAYVLLSMFVSCFGFYMVVTALPIISGNCPYQTPLSGSLWHTLRWLHLLRYRDLDVAHMGSMTEARQMLAMVYQPGRENRDFRALRWTLESLTEDAEFALFVEGIPGFLRSKSAMNVHGMTAVTHLLNDPAVGLADRINSLLTSCEKTRTLSSYMRQNRAVSCLDAIWSLTTLSFLSKKGAGGNWDSWCNRNPGHIVRNFLQDADPVIANLAFYTMIVLVSQLLQQFTVLPQVTVDDLDQLQRYIALGDSSSIAELSSQLLRRLHVAHVKGLEVLDLVDCLTRERTKVVHDALTHELRPVLYDAEAELRKLVPNRPRSPNIPILSSIATSTSVATPMTSQGGNPSLTYARQAPQQINRLRYALEEARFELVAKYVSHLSTETILPDKAIDTMRLTMSNLPDRPAHQLMQKSIIESLYDLVRHGDSQNGNATMGPTIDLFLGIVRHLDDEEAIQMAKEATLIYQRTNRRSKAANEALSALHKTPLAAADVTRPAAVTPFVDSHME